MLKIGILGVGELKEKVVIGLRRSGFSGRFLFSPRNSERAQELGRLWACEIAPSNQGVVDHSDLVFLGVRPDAVEQLANEVRLKPEQTLVSLVASMSIGELERRFP